MQSETLRLQGALHEIDRASRHAAAFCRAHGIAADDERILVLILEELITNTVKHGGAPPGSVIELALAHAADGVHVLYRDRGRAFDPTRDLPEPDFSATLPMRAPGGLGWPLIRYYCSSIDYSRDDDCNQLALVVSAKGREG